MSKPTQEIIEGNNDKSIMIKLTPTEIKNILRDFANRWAGALEKNTHYSLHELCDIYYSLSIGVMEKTDPDRFIHSS